MSLIINGIYKHYKGKNYQVLNIARNTDSLDLYVVYKALYDDPTFGKNTVWIRKKDEFLEEIVDPLTKQKIKRFEFFNK